MLAQSIQAFHLVASLSLASDEIVLSMAEKCNAKKSVAALSTYVDSKDLSHVLDLAEKYRVPRIGTQIESILAAKPTHVILASFNSPHIEQKVVKSRLQLVKLDRFDSSQDIFRHISSIGDAMNCKKTAVKMQGEFMSQLDSIRNSTKSMPRYKVLVYGENFETAGKTTLVNELLEINNYENLAATNGLTGWTRASYEAVLGWKPDYIVLNCNESSCVKLRSSVQKDPRWSRLDAVKQDKFIEVDPRIMSASSQFFGSMIRKN